MRIELKTRTELKDSRATRFSDQAEGLLGLRPVKVIVVDVFLLESDFGLSETQLRSIFQDSVAQEYLQNSSMLGTSSTIPDLAIEISWKPGVTDPIAMTARSAISLELGKDVPIDKKVQTATQVWYYFPKKLRPAEYDVLCASLYNPLIQREERLSFSDVKLGSVFPELYRGVQVSEVSPPSRLAVHTMDDQTLAALSKDRLLALTLPEMKVIRDYYADPAVQKTRIAQGIGIEATDVEVEMLAQSWSEHCKHKIFAANISYIDEEANTTTKIPGLFRSFIRKTTEILQPKRPDLRSMFHDNAGVVDFDDNHVVCFKVETHNSPSALDPYGGAITGIVGVNRDILGTGKGAAPIFNTNYLCFADPSLEEKSVPKGLLHPKKVMEGVHHGIVDGGNQSGIPTVAGGFLFDESYVGKPLVYCGTGGIMPRTINGEESWKKHIDAGDYAVMVGGRIGKDGIHGATFSSLALDDESPSSAVQIGDPITQRRVWDFLIEARDKGLYKGITDNGAGGLSSSLGEMAQASGGLRVDLDRCPLKYPGLAPWEIWVSESQERMSLSVDPDMWQDLQKLAKKHHVEATVIGMFTNTGKVELYYDDAMVALLDIAFIHEGLPAMELQALWPKGKPWRANANKVSTIDGKLSAQSAKEVLLKILSHPNVRSKESLVRYYDHEVQAHTMRQGFRGVHGDGPSDGALLRPVKGSKRALSVTHGVCPRVGDDDAYTMAILAVDEAYRSHIALGGDPDLASALDNFCWPDPVTSSETPDGAYKLAQLVRANMGLQDACLAYGLPLVSGKDSMKNDARVGGRKISIRPTLLISLMGIVSDSTKAPPSGYPHGGLSVVVLGSTQEKLGGSVFENLAQDGAFKNQGIQKIRHWGDAPTLNPSEQVLFYKRLHHTINLGLLESIHDISDGGLATAIIESCFHQRVGVDIKLPQDKGSRYLFSEHPGCFVASVDPRKLELLKEILGKDQVTLIGSTIDEPRFMCQGSFGTGVHGFTVPLNEALEYWKKAW